MAYNFRPRTQQEIKDLGLPSAKEKTVLELFKIMKASFGKNYDEFITIDTAPNTKGNTKILSDFKSMIDIDEYKKLYPGILLRFGDGSNPSSVAPTTQQQELVTLKIFEELLSSSTKTYKTFEQMIGKLSKIYPGITQEKSWYRSFELQFNEIEKTTKLPKNNFDVYNRDGGFMDYITALVNSKFQIAKKDSWNPADIWLIKSSEWPKYRNQLDQAEELEECNKILRNAYKKKHIVGISLKKNDGKKLNYEIVNLQGKPIGDVEVKFKKFNLNIPFDKKKKEFTSVTSTVEVQYQNKTYLLGVKSNQGQIANITFEFGGGGAAFLGKVPKDMLKLELKKDKFDMPEHTHFMKFDANDFQKKIAVIQKKKTLFNINGDLDTFVSNLKSSWSKGRSKDNAIISQIVTFAYIIASMSDKRRKVFIKNLFFMSQKKGDSFGPFGKLH